MDSVNTLFPVLKKYPQPENKIKTMKRSLVCHFDGEEVTSSSPQLGTDKDVHSHHLGQQCNASLRHTVASRKLFIDTIILKNV